MDTLPSGPRLPCASGLCGPDSPVMRLVRPRCPSTSNPPANAATAHAVGAILAILGVAGHAIGGRRHYF